MDRAELIDIINEKGREQDKFIEILLEVQLRSEGNFIDEEQLRTIAEALNIPFSKAYGIASFYTAISLKRRGKYVIKICSSVPCHIASYERLARDFEDILGISVGETTGDGVFSLEYTGCIGACSMAPAVRINDEVYGNLDRERILKLIGSIRRDGAYGESDFEAVRKDRPSVDR